MASFEGAVDHVVQIMKLRPLKQKQLDALQAFVSGRYTFVALPTGYGKSVSFLLFFLFFLISCWVCTACIVTRLSSYAMIII